MKTNEADCENIELTAEKAPSARSVAPDGDAWPGAARFILAISLALWAGIVGLLSVVFTG